MKDAEKPKNYLSTQEGLEALLGWGERHQDWSTRDIILHAVLQGWLISVKDGKGK